MSRLSPGRIKTGSRGRSGLTANLTLRDSNIEKILRSPKDAEPKLRALGFEDWEGAIKNLELLSTGALRDKLDMVLETALSSPSPDGALNNLETIVKEIPAPLFSEFLTDDKDLQRLITLCGSSPFLSGIIARNPDFFKGLFLGRELGLTKVESDFRGELAALTAEVKDFSAMAKTLRLYKQKEFLRLGARDLLGLSSVEELTGELSDLASASLASALDFSWRGLKEKWGSPLYTDADGSVKEAGFAVIGLGKLGGGELNFSSDIDIIYIYSSDKGETSGGRKSGISLHEFFVKLSHEANKLISSVTEDGFVFRIDLDLRPDGRSGDMANSLRSLEVYYESWGQTWERSAMIKARPVAGDTALGKAFLEMIRPFVFRRYLDFGSIEEIKSMKERIDLSLLRRNPDTVDVKLGQGGIREIEFFCQALQLINGGKDPEIREKNTLKALEKLLLRGLINGSEAGVLKEGYVFLRRLEHRIQIVEGRQSQAIPASARELERLARMMGFKDSQKKAGEYFWEEYKARTSAVHDIYRSLFYKVAGKEAGPEVLALFSPDTSDEEAGARLKELGFKDAKTALRNLTLLREPVHARLGARTRLLLQKLAPMLFNGAAASPDPDRALGHIERFVSAVGARASYYSLLAENPPVIVELTRLFGTSVFLSRVLIERPEGLEILLSRELSIPYKTSFLTELDTKGEYGEALDELRRLKNQEVFRIGVNDILGNLTLRQVSFQITRLAEASLEAACKIAANELGRLYGKPGGDSGEARFSVIGLGKLGGRDLSYGSDLDIIFIYSDTDESCSTTGPKVISNHEYFVKLGQRIISVLTLRTNAGFVFNVDTRLRPSGSSGPLVVSSSSFLKYHREKTAVWERQAFIKARGVAGSIDFAKEVLPELSEIIYSKTLTDYDISELLRIRCRMEAEIAKEDSTRYNIKTGKGGLVDIEFLTQALQLKHGSIKKLRTPYTLKALRRLTDEGIVASGDYAFLKKAYGFLRLLEARLRVVHDSAEGYLIKGSDELVTLARMAGYTGADADERLMTDYSGYTQRVRELYLKYLRAF